ncbi:hypothetical protein ACKS0A_03844 [Histoplasma ohiense]
MYIYIYIYYILQPTFKLMQDKGHRMAGVLGAHLADAGAEARDGQDDDVAHLALHGDAGKVLGGQVPAVRRARGLEVLGVVEVAEDAVGPDGGAGELDDGLVHDAREQDAGALHAQGVLSDGGDDVAQHRVARLGLDGPLAELQLARVPQVPVLAVVCVGLDADDQADGGAVDVGGEPLDGGL